MSGISAAAYGIPMVRIQSLQYNYISSKPGKHCIVGDRHTVEMVSWSKVGKLCKHSDFCLAGRHHKFKFEI